jgi:Ca-activated chloride channel family protein
MNDSNETTTARGAEDPRHERLCALVLGELSPEEARALEAELAADPELLAEKERIEATLELVATSFEGTDALPEEALRVLERAASPSGAGHAAAPSRPWYARPALQLAAGLAALATGVIGGRALWAPPAPESAAPVTEDLAVLERAPMPDRAARPAPRAAMEPAPEPVLRDAEVAATAEVAPSGGAGGYRGPGDSAPPASAAKGPVESKQKELRLRELGYVAGPSVGGGAGGAYGGRSGKRAPGAEAPVASSGGPSSPGPAGPAPQRPGAPAAGAGLHLPSGPATPGPTTPGHGGGVVAESRRAVPDATRADAPADARAARPEVLFELTEEEELDGDSIDGFLNDSGRLSDAEFDALCRDRAELLLQGCRRLPDERPADMFFRFWGDNPFVLTRLDALSTFGVDVDTASYALARRYLTEGHLPEKAQVRTEEFVNYFRPDLEPPREGTFAIHTELAPSRFGGGEDAPGQRWMLRVGLRGREVVREERDPLALTFVVDTSGSMRRENRMELVKHALRLLVAQLDGQDSIAIVAFENSARLVLPMTSAQSRGVIEAAIHGLQPGGGTNAEGGLMLGYEVAADGLTRGASNRVVLLSDGVANVGETDQDRINEAVRRRREAGIFLNTIGVGLGNHDDDFLEQLADRGDGICNYVDSETEARRALVDNFVGAFEPIARDVKIQVEFDPEQVDAYRLLGYENRAIADEDFRNDAVDAGEVGAGHQVVALYELDLTGRRVAAPLAEVRVRWKAPTGPGRDPQEDAATESARSVRFESATTFEAATRGYRRSVLVAQFAELLRRSVHARDDSLDELLAEARRLQAPVGSPEEDRDFDEFVDLVERSRELLLKSAVQEDDLTRCIDAVRRNRILRAQLEELRRAENEAVLAELERENERLEGRLRELLRTELERQYR